MDIKKEINEFNKDFNKDLFTKIVDYYFRDRHKCRECGGEICFNYNKIRLNRNNDNIIILGSSFNTVKKYGDKLVVCEDCIRKKFPEYDNLNKSKIFNVMCNITKWVFDIKDIKLYSTALTKEKMILKYGEKKGLINWNSYRSKQAESNTFKYKKEKLGWTKEQFDAYNKTRGVTLENLIKKHGLNKGTCVWNNYIKKQKLTKSFDYMVNKFGLEKTKKINNSKKLTIDHFIKNMEKN